MNKQQSDFNEDEDQNCQTKNEGVESQENDVKISMIPKSQKNKNSFNDQSPLKLQGMAKKSNSQLKAMLDKHKQKSETSNDQPEIMNLNIQSAQKIKSSMEPEETNTFSLSIMKSESKPQNRPPLRESNPNSKYKKEQEQIEKTKCMEEEKAMQEKNERDYYKLADYFCTIGIDDYFTQDEIYREDTKRPNKRSKTQIGPDIIQPQENILSDEENETPGFDPSINFSHIDRSTMKEVGIEKVIDKDLIKSIEFPAIEPDEIDFDQVISKMEVFIIRDQDIFKKDQTDPDGRISMLKHPEDIHSTHEKWIDLRGDKCVYLRLTFDNAKNCRKPITDFNFFWISRQKQQIDKMSIHVKQNIEPIPVKEFGVFDSEQKHRMTKCIGKKGNEDTYNFYGNYDLSSYIEDMSKIDPSTQKKNLCICITKKRAAPIQDVCLCVGQKIDTRTGQIIDFSQETSFDKDEPNNKHLHVNWDVPEGYKKLPYCMVGTNGKLNRLLCHRTRDILKRKLKAKVIDRYPPEGQDRHYYPFPTSISDFCFPSGITLQTEQGSPEFFHFQLTDQDGKQIYGTTLIFDEEPSIMFKEKLKQVFTKNIQHIRTLKAICILSHYSFNGQFKEILKQLYRMQISNTRFNIPIERFIVNIIDEIPLPDEGTQLIQHEIGGQITSFFRPNDQNPPLVEKNDIENLFRCLSVENIIEIYSYLLLERKILIVSKHKSLLTTVMNCFQCFLFPFQWKHTMVPILPINLLDMLESPMPYFVGVEPHPYLDQLEINEDVIRVELDSSEIIVPESLFNQSTMPSMPGKEYRQLKQRLMKASEIIETVPDLDMFDQVDKAFNMKVEDPEEEGLFDHYEIRDAFLQFIQFIMTGYSKYIIDPSLIPEKITCFKDCFNVDQFRLTRDAKTPFKFIYKFTDTIHFSYFIECRSLGRSERDAQIIAFDKLMTQTRTKMMPRLIFPFHEEKSIKTMQPNEEGVENDQTWGYNIFPKLNLSQVTLPRQIPDYNLDTFAEQIMGQMIKNQDLLKMHDAEWARYMLEVLYLLWFQVFSSTLPYYFTHTPRLIDFAKKLLNYVRSKIKPMRDIEYIYRKLFYSCGTCKQINILRELYKDMLKNKIIPDKITSGTYYWALIQCKRRGGTKEANQDTKKQYFSHKMEDYAHKLNQHQDDDNRSNNGSLNRMSNISMEQRKREFEGTTGGKDRDSLDEEIFENFNAADIDKADFTQTQQTALDTQFNRMSNISNSVKLSNVLENSLFMDIEKMCLKCKEMLREEEILTGFQKDLNNYTVKCPKCQQCFVPKFTIYSEQDNVYINGKKGQKINLLPPITLYKQFFNLVTQKGDEILMDESFINEHQCVYWNIILYFKILKLPTFMLDMDYSPYHQKMHCTQIKKFLPEGKVKQLLGNLSNAKRQNSFGRPPQKLDSNALKQLENAHGSSGGFVHVSMMKGGSGIDVNGDNVSNSGVSNGGRHSSINRGVKNVFNMFSAKKKNKDQTGSFVNIDSMGNENQFVVPNITNKKPQLVQQDGQQIQIKKGPGGGIQAIHYDEFDANGALKPPTLHGMGGGPQSQAVENEKKGFGGGIQNMFTNFKKATSLKSMGKAGSVSGKSGGAGSVVTSLSDLEKIEKIMNEAQFADKSIVKYFGKHFEEFRREMHYNKEIVFADMLSQFGQSNNIQDNFQRKSDIEENMTPAAKIQPNYENFPVDQ